ncbi:insulinase family protein [Candidatus Bipolaricaulota bacterium]|nr:insulinase family protein [Candidatus Bipolaricaulota bacterium]
MELFPGCYRKKLDGGIEIIGQEEPGSKSISIGLWFKSGSRDETRTSSGITHLIEHLLFRGTENRTSYQITSDVDRLGGHINGSTGREFLLLSLRLLPESLSRGIDILTDLAFNPLFREEDLELEKDVVLEEIRSSHDDHQSEAIRLLEETIWGDSSGLSLPVRGLEDTLSRLTREEVLDRFTSLQKADEIMITAAGNLTMDNLIETSSGSIEGLIPLSDQGNGGNPANSREGNSGQPDIRHKHDWRDINQLHCVIGTEGLAKKDEDRFPLEMLNVILGQGMSSRLFRKIRKDRGLAYQVTSSTQYYFDTGLFFVYGAIAPQNLDRFLNLVLKEFERIKAEQVSEEELELAKKKTKGNLVLGLENNRALMSRLGITALHDNDFLSVGEVVEKIENVSRNDIQSVAQRLLPEEEINYSLLGPKIPDPPQL